MAGDWIKMRVDLADDPSVLLIASHLGVEEDVVVGKLHRLWSWADRHAHLGRVDGIGHAWLDRFLNCTGFAAAMGSAGWLIYSDHHLEFPRFSTHNGKPAKERADAQARQAKHRNGPVTEMSRNPVTDPLPEERREEKIREEKNINDKDIPPPSASEPAKEKAPRKTASTEHATVVSGFCDRFLAARGTPYAVQGAKDGAHVKALLGMGSVPEILVRADRLLADPWYAERGCDLGTLRGAWNRLTEKPVAKERTNGYAHPSPHSEFRNGPVLDF